MNWKNYIESKPEVLFGKPVVKNTRIPVDLILDKMSSGESIEELLAAYPRLDLKAIYAILAFASETIKNQKIYSLAS